MKKNLLLLAVAMTVAFGMSAETAYVNETSKVGTSKEAWHGTGMYGNKPVTPLGGTSVGLSEFYCEGDATSQLVPGFTPLHQTVAGLTAGTYKVEFYVTAHEAWGKVSLGDKGATANVAYVKVGSEEKTAPFTSYQNNGMADNEPIKVTFDNLTITEGTNLEMGIKVVEEKATNWYTIQICSLQREATDAEILQNEVNVMNENKAKLQAIIDKYQYATDAAKEPYKNLLIELESVDTTSLEAVKEANTKITTLLGDTLKERKLAEEDAVLASLNATPITIVNPNADQPEAQDTAWKWYKGGSSDFKQKSDSNNRPTLSDGTTINTYFDGWNDSENWRFGVQQNVELEPGEYRLSVMYRAGGLLKYFRLIAAPDHDAAERLGYFEKDNDSDVTDPHTNLSKITGGAGEVFGNGWAIDHLDFTIEEPTAPASNIYKEEATKKNVCIAAMAATWSKAEKSSSARWASFTHFQLVKKPKDVGSGIPNAVVEDVNAPVEYFDLNGIRVNADNLKKGIYIKRQGNKVTKIIK